jgi:hypothetical protein
MRFIAVISFLVCCHAAWAGDAQPSPPPSKTEEDPVVAAKRELDALKAARNAGASAQEGNISNLGVPDIHAPESMAPRAKPEAELLQKKTDNWLVDAMKQTDRAAKNRDRRERTGDGKDDEKRSHTDAARGQSAPAEQSPGTRTAIAVVNPFARYLADWMTPQDYAVLRSAVDRNDPSRGSVQSDPSQSGALPTEMTPLFGGDLASFGASSENRQPATSTENPYLSALTMPAVPQTFVPPVPAPASPSTGPVLLAPVAPAEPPSKSTIPDFAKPSGDEKYFKQLKRF